MKNKHKFWPNSRVGSNCRIGLPVTTGSANALMIGDPMTNGSVFGSAMVNGSEFGSGLGSAFWSAMINGSVYGSGFVSAVTNESHLGGRFGSGFVSAMGNGTGSGRGDRSGDLAIWMIELNHQYYDSSFAHLISSIFAALCLIISIAGKATNPFKKYYY